MTFSRVLLQFTQLFLRKVKKKSQNVLVVMKKALNLQQKSIKQLKQHLITQKTKFYEKENFTFAGFILYDDSNVGIFARRLSDLCNSRCSR